MGIRINAQWTNLGTQELDISYMHNLATLIDFKMIWKHTHRVVFMLLIKVRAPRSLMAIANIYQ